MVEKIQYIPARLRNMAKEGHVAGTADIIDDDKNKTQEQINEEVIGDNAESHKNRIEALDEIHSINVDDEEHAITTDPAAIVEGSGLIPAANAVAGVMSELIDNYGHYAENPEFIRVYLDSEDRVLWGIQRDGNIYYGAGVPSQVIDYINEKIAELSLDEYEDIVAFLDGLEKGDKTLQKIINEINASIDTKADAEETADALNLKVDKVEGKSLIDEEYASTKSAIESPEFIDVILDADDKVLEGIQADGTKVIGGDINVGGSANINGGLRVLGNMEVSGVSYKVIENPEFLEAKVDAEGKLIEGINKNGEKIFGVIPPQIKQYIDDNMPAGGSGVQSIEYDEETGDMYATYDDEGGITDVSMEPNGDIYVEYEE